jgi:uncharacterized RmlC-like cupin family protein
MATTGSNACNTTSDVVMTSVAEFVGQQSVQDQLLVEAVSRRRSGAKSISAGLCIMPAGHHSRAHLHEQHEIVIYVLEGRAATLWGWDLKPTEHGPGDFVYVPAGTPHVAVNLSERARLLAIEHRTDPEFNTDVTLLPDLYERAASIAADLRRRKEPQWTSSSD